MNNFLSISFTKIDFFIVIHFHCYVNNDSLCFFATSVLSTRISRKQYKLNGWNLLWKTEKLMTLEQIFKKCKSLDNAQLQLRVE